MGDMGVSVGGVISFTYPAAVGSDFYIALLVEDPDLDLREINHGDDVYGSRFLGVGLAHGLPARWGIGFNARTQQISNLDDLDFGVVSGAPGLQTATHAAWLHNGFLAPAVTPNATWSNLVLFSVNRLVRPLSFNNGGNPIIPIGQCVLEVTAVEQ